VIIIVVSRWSEEERSGDVELCSGACQAFDKCIGVAQGSNRHILSGSIGKIEGGRHFLRAAGNGSGRPGRHMTEGGVLRIPHSIDQRCSLLLCCIGSRYHSMYLYP
jgi:hypothetical protein